MESTLIFVIFVVDNPGLYQYIYVTVVKMTLLFLFNLDIFVFLLYCILLVNYIV